ncbi:PLP-dependent aminotransferase family protein [Erwinia sp. BC051422]|uniref:MocR-like pyridoxine biosynthesis transcription factor PdxR n=1 Tax=Erwinia wuhanensis TaxID=3045167 RepID=UPI002652BCBF|nr:PLP-dependent aminotransferase family protein [Erwinia sp. BC051422]MDN8541623.1 PLP-dependent aminotransferase family protein [Erwinia sp. BC051422]
MRTLVGDLVACRLGQTAAGTLGKRLYDALQQSIQKGMLAPGTRLPASRDLAAELGVSRNTVMAAYEQLQSEGYLTTRAGSGTFVSASLPESDLSAVERIVSADVPSGQIALSRRGEQLLNRAGASQRQWGAFMPGVPDVRHFPHKTWHKITRRLNLRLPVETLSYSQHGGYAPLQHALADYLRVARSVKCTPEQILIASGTHQSLDLLAKMLCNPGDRVWVEEPGYWGHRSVLEINGLETVPIAVDDEGMTLPAGVAPPRLICVTPSHQYPTGAVMGLARRQALLRQAQAWGSIIIEDDYDSEFRFGESPVPALQGLAQDENVIYLGTFSKTLYPGLRTSYMVVPDSLTARLKVAHSELYRGGYGLTQLALAEFIREGHYAAHVRRMRQLYGQRREALVGTIRRELGAEFIGQDSHAGLHLILALPPEIDDVALAYVLEQQGIWTRPLSVYYRGEAKRRGLILGYACVEAEAMTETFVPVVHALLPLLAK